MSHVGHQVGTVGVGNLPEAGVVQVARVARHPGDQDLGLEQGGCHFHLVVINQAGGGVNLTKRKTRLVGITSKTYGCKKKSNTL